MIPITMTKKGEFQTIQKINGKEETKQFLHTLGFIVGSNVRIISKIGENVILNVKDSRIALDSTMANKIIVS